MRITTAAIILRDKRVLLIKRSDYSRVYPSTWVCPGGRAEGNETPEQAVIRETKEEIGLDFRPTRLFEKKKYSSEARHFTGHQFLGTWKGEPRPCEEEVADWNWYTYKEALRLDLGFNYRDVIKKLHNEDLL